MSGQPQPVGPKAYPCPNCQSKPGDKCTQPTNTGRKPVDWFHDARVSKAAGW